MANDTSFSNPALQIQNAAWIEINLSHLLHNLELIRSTVGPRVSIMAMVKSNAYGHGMVDIAKFLKDRVDMLGVASLKEALELRSAGISSPIFVFGTMFPHEIEECLEKKLAICISSLEQAQAISRRLAGRAEMLRVHIKIDTGMGRMGILAERAKNEILEIAGLQGIVIEGILTHFAVADRPEDPFTEQQISIFKQIVESCEQHGMYFLYKHAANSAAIFSNPSSHFNMVRPGLALYGVSPFPFPLLFPPKADPPLAEKGEGRVRVEHGNSRLPLKPVMSVKVKVGFIKKLPKGHSTSYGRNFILEEEGDVAVLPIGYGQGIPYHVSGNREARVLISGRPYPICGNICMDYTLVYLGPKHDIKPGDEAVILGCQGKEQISAYEIAGLAGTIPYEVLARFSSDIERWYA